MNTLIIIGTIVGGLFGFYKVEKKNKENEGIFDKYQSAGCVLILIYALLGAFVGWVLYI